MLSRKLVRQIRKLNLQPRRAILGDRDGVLDEPGRPGFVRVRYPASPENTDALAYPTTIRINAVVPKKLNGKVLVGYDPDGEVAVIGSDFSGTVAAGENPITNNPADEVNARYVDQRDITTLRSQPLGPGAPMWISVLGWPYIDSDGVYHEFIGESTNLTSYIPAASDEWCLVLVALKTDDTLEITQSTDQNVVEPLDSTDIQECIDGLTAGSTVVHLYKLVNGMVNILDEHNYMDMRQLVNVGFPGGAGSSPWQTTSNVANLITSTDNVTVGSATNLGKLGVDGDTDEIQLAVQGHATQTNPLILAEKSTGTDVFAVSNDGAVTQASYTDLVEIATPSTPASNHARIYTHGEVLSGIGSDITEVRIATADATEFVLGRDTRFWVRNTTGSTVVAGKPVTLARSGSVYIISGLAKADAYATLADAVVIQDIANNAWGWVLTEGFIEAELTTHAGTGWNYLSPTTAGDYTTTPPTGANFSQRILLANGVVSAEMYVHIERPTPPASPPVGLSDTQTITNKTFDNTNSIAADAIDSATLDEARLPHKFALIEEQQAQNTAGGGSTATTWTTRVLNTEVVDADSIVSISSNQFTPIAGTYRMTANSPFVCNATTASQCRCRLYNVTQAAVVVVSANHYVLTNANLNVNFWTQFTANGSDAYAIQYYITQARATNGLGNAVNEASAVERYTQALLEKIA